MQTLADDGFDWLQSLTIGESLWFEGGRDDCMDSLVTIIAKQQELQFLDLHGNEFIEEQESRIRGAVASPDCRVIITLEEYIAYKKEQGELVEEESKQALAEHVPEETKQEPIERETSTEVIAVQNLTTQGTAQETAQNQKAKRHKSIRRRKNREH